MDAQLLEQLERITEEESEILKGNGVDMGQYSDRGGALVDSAKMLSRGKLIAIRPATRFTAFPDHKHNYIEMVYMCRGQTRHTVNGSTEILLKAGELLLLNQHARHAIAPASKEDIAVNFIVLPQFFDVALEMIGPHNPRSNFLIGSLRQDTDGISFLHFQVSDVLPVQNLLENLIWNLQKQEPNRRSLNQNTMGLLFLQLLNCTERLATDETSAYQNALVMAALREIEEHYKTASLGNLASEHHVSLAYLSRLVKESTGKSFKMLLQAKRLSKAAALLRQSRMPVREILTAVGYENSSYFYRIFQSAYGKSPNEYRNSVK